MKESVAQALARLPVARIKLRFRATGRLRLPEYGGSALRGAFGLALRRSSCITRQKICTGCPLLRSCPYTAIFEPPPPLEKHALQRFTQMPAAFVIEPPSWGARTVEPGEVVEGSMVLAGRVVGQLPLVILAWQQALARGVGRGRGAAVLESVHEALVAGDAEVYRPDAGELRALSARLPAPPTEARSVILEFSTPLRLQERGQPLRDEALNPRRLLMGLVRRTALVAEAHAGIRLGADFTDLKGLAKAVTDERDLHWRDWRRYSARQDQEFALGGLVGRWRLSGGLQAFLPFIHIGQWLHVGKSASFGLGRYTAVFE